jgi:serine phosphatase RsbU (regulator of sigma subunit)
MRLHSSLLVLSLTCAPVCGLPLGLSAQSVYRESKCRYSPGARFTLLSDGVVEALNAHGELFGFERTAHTSSQSAEAIARTAQIHGQEDGITVLALILAPAVVLSA